MKKRQNWSNILSFLQMLQSIKAQFKCKIEPTREEVNTLTGATMLEFGASWCGYCKAAQSTITSELALFSSVRHIKIEDGKGRRLGRSFHVKLWPTLIFMKDGVELKRLVRNIDASELRLALQELSA